jgi:hypothetical protein
VGNRALGWDLLPPSAVGTGAGGKSYQGDSESSNRKVKENRDGWYAGLQYDQDVGAAQNVLKNLSTYYPGAKDYEVAGFFWWQGNAERGKGSVENYDKNLAFLFNDLKKDFNAPNAKFVCATLGEHDKNATLSQKMFDFAGRPEFEGQAAVFYTKPVSKGGSSGGHYSGHAETYMNVGLGMGALMAEMLGQGSGSRPSRGSAFGQGTQAAQPAGPRKISPENYEKIRSALLRSLVALSDSGKLREMPLQTSFTSASVWLKSARDDGTLTFGMVGSDRSADLPWSNVTPQDQALLAMLVATLSPDSGDAQGLAGVYAEIIGNVSVAQQYFSNAGASRSKWEGLLQ